MTIIVFLLDTSASMNQRVFLGGRPNLFDVAKSAVETFVKVRQRSPDSRGDRYMLLTFEEPPNNIKAGWKENLQTFMSELKNLQATGLTTLSQALRHTFDVLNVNRMQHGIDTYGQGRCPFYLEPCIIVAITDGCQLCSNSGVTNEIKFSGTSPGVELTREPFRWDQRLFSLVLRMSGQPSNEREIGIVPSDTSPIDSWCEITGGRSYCITTHRMLHQCIDSLVQKVQAGVVLHFEKYGIDPPLMIPDGLTPAISAEQQQEDLNLKWTSCHKMIYVPRQNQTKGFAGGFWPLPESFWPEANLPSLPPRSSHPHAKFVCTPHEPLVIENFPFDKYELEPSPLTQYILARKQPNVCWQVFVPNSSKSSSLGQPFGYLKSSSSLTCVNLFVMPYNYPLLLPLLDDLIRVFRLKPTNEWRAQFAMYLSTMPPYYAGPLKRALLRIGAGNIAQMVPEENYLSYSVLNYLKKLKTQAKMEFERTCNEVGARVGKELPRRIHVYKNPFDIPRDQLLDHLSKLRGYFFRPTQSINSAEALHNQPVAAMGNYQEFIKRMPQALREIESAPTRQHMFGNPFKIDKRMIVDEAIDIDLIGGKAEGNINNNPAAGSGSPSNLGNMSPNMPRGTGGVPFKRKSGPLSKDFVYIPKKYKDLASASPASSSNYSRVPSPTTPMEIDEPEIIEISPQNASMSTTYVNHSNLIQLTPPNQMKISTVVIKDEDYNVLVHPQVTETIFLDDDEDEDSLDRIENKPNSVETLRGPYEEFERSQQDLENHISQILKQEMNGGILQPSTSIQVPVILDRLDVSNSSTSPEDTNEDTWRQNIEVRTELHKEIRRPRIRKDYLLSQLALIAGSSETRLKFVRELEKEALRFKRKGLAKLFEEQRLEMLKSFETVYNSTCQILIPTK